eukprot:6200296-Pleurochrysis_carterae.AAC.1
MQLWCTVNSRAGCGCAGCACGRAGLRGRRCGARWEEAAVVQERSARGSPAKHVRLAIGACPHMRGGVAS